MNKYLALAIITLSEATIGIFVKLTGDHIPIFTLNFYRVFFASVFLLIAFFFVDRNFWKISKKNIKPILVISVLIALQISLFNIAMKYTPIANVVVLWSTYPFFVFIFSALFLKEKITKEHIIVFVLAIMGIIITKPFGGGHVFGNTISMFGGLVYATLISYMKYQDETESPALVSWYMLGATILLLPALFLQGTGNLLGPTPLPAIQDIPVIVWAICLGVISTGLAYFFIVIVLKKIKAGIYSLVDVIVSPVVAALLGFIVLGEVPNISMIYGGTILILSGFWISTALSSGNITTIEQIFYFIIRKKKEEEPVKTIR